ncbi:MAG: SAM-dependent methyltransferase, partial [Chloroflexota bacterium]|nr:SAM-dependent methyltransferase [Chloroflexota bacterium]
RWQFGPPPVGNANYAWVQHIISKLTPRGLAGFVLANGSLSAGGVEGEIRRQIVEADLVDCIVSLPGQLFFSTQIPVSLWFLARDKSGGVGEEGRPLRDRRGETLFIDARQLGHLISRTQRDLADDDISRITGTYHAWRGDGGEYMDVPGFCNAVLLKGVSTHGYVLTPGRFVGVEASSYDAAEFATTFTSLFYEFRQQVAHADALNREIEANLNGLMPLERSDETSA